MTALYAHFDNKLSHKRFLVSFLVKNDEWVMYVMLDIFIHFDQ